MKLSIDPRKTYPRRFVPDAADMGKWEEIEPLGEALLARSVESVPALERWLEDRTELTACVLEVKHARYIAMTIKTDDPEREQAYLSWVQEIEPKWKDLDNRVDRAYLANPVRRSLPEGYAVMDRLIQNSVELYRDENVPLETTEEELKQQYQKVMGAMTVVFQGEERTIQQMARYLEEPDRALRQSAWEAVTDRRLVDEEALEDLFDQLLAVRAEIAKNAGFDSYRDYAFRRLERFDYGPQDCFRFHDAIERYVVPLAVRLGEERQARLGIPTLRPWDMNVDPLNRPPLRPFERVEELLDRSETLFARMDVDLAELFQAMRREGLLDLESRKGKAPGGYQHDLTERRLPFIFMNAVGIDLDVVTIVHEAGHAFNAFAARELEILQYRFPPAEFAEVASMGMELLAFPYLDAFYPEPSTYQRALRDRIDKVILVLPWIATIDAFQQWLYENRGHSRDQRRQAWIRFYRRFHPSVDWSGYDRALRSAWHRQLHVFQYPFYYIEYGIAQLGALQIWQQSRQNFAAALGRYLDALALGGSRPLPELFSTAGARFAFDGEAIGPLSRALSEELDRAPYV
ncbi:MAG TPA: M3 family oligoendopeptidase [bacterium]